MQSSPEMRLLHILFSVDQHKADLRPQNYRYGCIYRTMQIPRMCSYKICISQLFVLSTSDKVHSDCKNIFVGIWAKLREKK